MPLTLNNNFASMQAGQYMWAKYTSSTSGAVGTFSDLGSKNGVGFSELNLNYNTTVESAGVSLATYNNVLYMSWCENAQVRVKKWNNEGWVTADNTASLNYNTANSATYTKLIVFNNELYILWLEVGNLRAKKWDGSSWITADNNTNINSGEIIGGSTVTAIVYKNELYTAYSEKVGTPWLTKLKKYNGSSWVSVNNDATLNYDNTKTSQNLSLEVFNDELYIAWAENNASSILRIRVKKYNGTTFSSADNNTALYSVYTSQHSTLPKLFVNNNKLHIVHIQKRNNGYFDIPLLSYNGTNWTTVNGYISSAAISVTYGHIDVINYNGISYIGFARDNQYGGTDVYGLEYFTYDGITVTSLGLLSYSNFNYKRKDTCLINYNNDVLIGFAGGNSYSIGIKNVTSSELSTNSASATPNGYFKLICVGEDNLGKKKLIADRNIQTAISWQTLNTAGLAHGIENSKSSPKYKLANISSIPNSTINGIDISKDGQYAAFALSASPYMAIYKIVNDEFIKLANPTTLPTGSGQSASFSSDGTYLAVAHQTTPFVSVYKRSGDTFTKLNTLSSNPAGPGYGVAWSPNDTYMSVAHGTTPFISIYKRSGDTLTKLNNPDILPASTGTGIAFSSDNNYLAIAQFGSPYITIYKRTDDSFAKLNNPGVLPTGKGEAVAFSPDNNYLAVAHQTTPFLTVYSKSGDSFTKLNTVSANPADVGRSLSFSSDNNYLAVGHGNSPFASIYKRSSDTFAKLNNLYILPGDTGVSIKFTPNGTNLLIGSYTSPYIHIYRNTIMPYNASYKYTLRLITGGLSISDVENEWDKILLKYDLNGNITAGDTAIWNHNGLYNNSTTLTTNSALGNNYRVARGIGTSNTHDSYLYSDTSVPSYRPLLLIEPLDEMKYLLKDGDNIYTIVNGSKSLVGTIPLTVDVFQDNGLSDLTTITDGVIRTLDNPEVIGYSLPALNNSSIVISAIPNGKLLLGNTDITFGEISNVDNFTITSTLSGSGVIKIILSTDQGSTWKTYNGTSWVSINPLAADAKASGITPSVLNAIPSAKWMEIINSATTLRFGYYLEISSISDNASINTLAMQTDTDGRWNLADNADGSYSYYNKFIRVELTSSGNFKINY